VAALLAEPDLAGPDDFKISIALADPAADPLPAVTRSQRSSGATRTLSPFGAGNGHQAVRLAMGAEPGDLRAVAGSAGLGLHSMAGAGDDGSSGTGPAGCLVPGDLRRGAKP